jgi:hypothetical protein
MALAGGCQCRRIVYRLAPRHYQLYACHCRECQKQSASAFALSMPAWFADLSLTGEPASYVRATDSGTRTACFFCPDCGTRLFHRSQRSPEVVTVKAGSLADLHDMVPVAHLWVCRKLPWVLLPPETPCFDTQPQDLKTWRDGLLPR